MGLREVVKTRLLYPGYERRLLAHLEFADKPRHVGVLLDGNRRWARSMGLADVSDGHRRGADKIVDLLDKPFLPNSQSKFLFYFLCSKLFVEEHG